MAATSGPQQLRLMHQQLNPTSVLHIVTSFLFSCYLVYASNNRNMKGAYGCMSLVPSCELLLLLLLLPVCPGWATICCRPEQ